MLKAVCVILCQHKHTFSGKGDVYIPFQTCNVSQFAFAAVSGVAAGHKVNSSRGKDGFHKDMIKRTHTFMQQSC